MYVILESLFYKVFSTNYKFHNMFKIFSLENQYFVLVM